MPFEPLTLRSVEVTPVVVPLKRPVVSKVGLFDHWPIILIDLQTEQGIVGRSYLEPFKQSARYLVPAIRDLAEARRGQAFSPFDDFRRGRAALGLVGLEGMSLSGRGPRHGDVGRARQGSGHAACRAAGRIDRATVSG